MKKSFDPALTFHRKQRAFTWLEARENYCAVKFLHSVTEFDIAQNIHGCPLKTMYINFISSFERDVYLKILFNPKCTLLKKFIRTFKHFPRQCSVISFT